MSFSSLPDEIIVNCLARIPRSYYPRLSIVSKSFRSIISSTELYAERSRIGTTEHCLYVCLSDPNSLPSLQWFRLWINPNRTLPKLVQIPHSNLTSVTKPTVVVGSQIYVIGGRIDGKLSSAVRVLDCRSHTWRYAPNMNVARNYAASCVYDGKIYVLRGCNLRLKNDEPWGEVFDTKTQTWERLPDPGTEIRRRDAYIIMEMEGKIYVGDLKNMYAYDTKLGKWERFAFRYPRGDCAHENVIYCGHESKGSPISEVCWYDIVEGGDWKDVQGLDPLRGMYNTSCHRTKLVGCGGGKILHLWENCRGSRKRIFCAEITVEKRDGGELWGNVEWVDVVHTVPSSCELEHCLVVSV